MYLMNTLATSLIIIQTFDARINHSLSSTVLWTIKNNLGIDYYINFHFVRTRYSLTKVDLSRGRT